MASTAFFKGTGLLLFLLLGLQPSSFVSGQNTTSSSNTTTDATTTVAATIVLSTDMSTVSATATMTVTTAQATMSSAISSTNAAMSSAGLATTMAATRVQGAANTATSNSSSVGSMTTAMTSTSRSVTIDNSRNTVAGSGTPSTDNTTSWGTSGMTMISCRQFSCNYSDCYDVYMNRTSVSCNANITFCELKRQEDMTYTGGCSSSCRNACVNNTQTNCTTGCCNSTGCLRSTLASMVRPNTTTVTTVMMTTTTTTAAATTTTAMPTNKLKKCQMFQCTEQNCYKTWITKDPMPCPLNQPYCELKKMTIGSTTMWMGGCNADCTRNTWCTTTTGTCHQECCNTSITSCLKLDGSLNVPSSATRGPHFPLALITAALLVCLLSIGSLV
ncbi:haze protective factor 1-like [Oncorhynchus tshawytscha]|uniref:haze protective factor 1-like n=1 Tax=Oncorhynchus tshawytscha TaxID=74940 RepID=UPI000D09A631|nr:haze protective factor 1-like [Oncorhynchus tshawytscha]